MQLINPSAGGVNKIIANCSEFDVPGSCVYISGPSASENIFTVTRVDITNPLTMPAIGVIASKLTPQATHCTVILAGLVYHVFTNLTPNARYFISAAGRPMLGPPEPEDMKCDYCMQCVGMALDENTLFVAPDLNPAIRSYP